MNKTTYKHIAHAKDFAQKLLESLKTDTKLNYLIDLAQDAEGDYDDKSENWQDSEKGQEESARIEHLNSIMEDFESLQTTLDSIISSVEEIENDAPEGSFN